MIMMKTFLIAASAGLLLTTTVVGIAQSTDEGELDTTLLYQSYPGTQAGEVRKSPAPGLWEVNQGSAYGYVTSDGRYMVQGDLIDLKTGESITEARRDEARRELIADIGEQNMIVFSPSDKPARHVVNVFTDTSCGYCRKLHQEMADYHAQGIEIRYLFYPRRGPGSEPFKVAESVWCADDRNAAMTAAKALRKVPEKSCPNPVMQHYVAGQQAGLRGTPMMILEDGTSISGYVPAAALAQRIAARGL